MASKLHTLLLQAAQKALKNDLSEVMPKSSIKKIDNDATFAPYDLSLGEFFVPGVTKKDLPSEEQRMILGLKSMVKKLQSNNTILKEKLKTDKEKMLKSGFDLGYKRGDLSGYNRGKSEVTEKVDKIKQNMSLVLQEIEKKKRKILNNSERKTLEIIFQISENIIHKECSLDKEIVFNTVKRAIEEVSSKDKIVVKINPNEIEGVRSEKDFWNSVNSGLSEISIVEDPNVECGGCIIGSGFGTVDAGLSTQLDEIKATVLKCWEEDAGEIHTSS